MQGGHVGRPRGRIPNHACASSSAKHSGIEALARALGATRCCTIYGTLLCTLRSNALHKCIVCPRVHVAVRVSIRVYVCVSVCVCVCALAHAFMCVNVCLCTLTYIHAYTCQEGLHNPKPVL